MGQVVAVNEAMCPQGKHPATEMRTNSRGTRYCRECCREYARLANCKRRKTRPARTHCDNGHDLSVYGRARRDGRKKTGLRVRCVQCERDRRRNAHLCGNGHVYAEVGWVEWRGRRRCRACIEEWQAKLAAKRKAAEFDTEDETWFDWVIARRVGRGENPGRKLTLAEFAECMKAYGLVLRPDVLATRMKVGPTRVRRWLQEHRDECYIIPPWWAEVWAENPRQLLESAA